MLRRGRRGGAACGSADQQAEDALPRRQAADPLARPSSSMPATTNRSSRRPSGREHAHGAVAGVHVPDRGLHDVVQRRLELAAGGRGARRRRRAPGSDAGWSGGRRSTRGRAGSRPDGRRPGRDAEAVPARRGHAPRARRRRGRTGDGLAEQGLATGAHDDEVGAAGGGGQGVEDGAVQDGGAACGPWTPVSAMARSTCASRRSWAASWARTRHPGGARQRIAVRGVEDADGHDGRLAAGGLAQRPDERPVGGRPSRRPRRPARGSAGGAAAARAGSTTRRHLPGAGCGVCPGPARLPRRADLAHGGVVAAAVRVRDQGPGSPDSAGSVRSGRRLCVSVRSVTRTLPSYARSRHPRRRARCDVEHSRTRPASPDGQRA